MDALAAAGGGTARLDGKMVDRPHERLARRLLDAQRN
jgi:citrate lyase beta subunit